MERPESVRSWGIFEPFDPTEGIVVRDPPGQGAGYWAGAPGAWYDRRDGQFYLVYRLRRPRGVEPDRGAEVHLARSSDGIEFDVLWVGRKEELGSPSIERCALIRDDNGRWLLYVSYVDPADGRWRIDLVEADSVDRLKLSESKPVLTAADTATEGVKDPFVFRLGRLYFMIVSYAVADAYATPEQLHASADAYNTGLIKSCTGLATSEQGRSWQWEGALMTPEGRGWDGYCTRIGTLWYQPPLWLALYDGSADLSENYEERCGLALSMDLRHFCRVSRSGPIMSSKFASGSARYFDVIRLPNATYFYYELARADGAHELRVHRA